VLDASLPSVRVMEDDLQDAGKEPSELRNSSIPFFGWTECWSK
jgi:hypothetical protein